MISRGDPSVAPTPSAATTAEALVETVLRHQAGSPVRLRRLLALRGDDQFAAPELAQLISLDPLVSQRIRDGYARLVERGRQRPFTARDAIDASGYRPIHCSSVGCMVVDLIDGTRLGPEYRPFWWWSYAVASFASVISETIGAHQDEAFAGGLLRNIARMLLQRHGPPEALMAVAAARDAAISLHEAEQRLLGYSHLDVGRGLARAWSLPEPVLAAFDEDDGRRRTLAGVIRRASAAASHYGFHDPRAVAPPEDEAAVPDPIIEGYLHILGGLEFWRAGVRGFIASARIDFE
jgi:hypothetical protein